MKKIALLLILISAGTISSADAQTFEAPKSGVTLEVQATKMTIAPGGEISIDIWMNRSKRAR